MNHLVEKTTNIQAIYQGRIIDLQIEDVLLPNGETSKREVVKHPGAVGIIPITSEGKLVMVRQYRKALEKVIVEIPAGKLDHQEEPIACAKRELQEETGYVSNSMDFVVSFYTSPGFANEIIHIYVAGGLEKKEMALDEDEFLDVIEVSIEEAEEMIQNQIIHDAKTIYAVQYMQLKLAKKE
ncbi:NUDIX domain-containing protein [Alkalihalobacillus pseudalcaliphilus]|uniref:NUDIX domain-containing protein n=1 Tax=Alkalihalobacillus pseudalcaliphilus TaxID=79884 RepID=UPI00064DF000|nr:NUDIX hydrolase [Alkalihalobacillus pseudalcaliphilus]KMK76097.1 ADP-ribose pyrophosphatase [Alkalihalobacillus pseudalcaliphilus]